MDTEVDDMEYVNLIDSEVEKAYTGLLLEYHKSLGRYIAHLLAAWCNPDDLEDLLSEIRYARNLVDEQVYADSQQSRHDRHYHKG